MTEAPIITNSPQLRRRFQVTVGGVVLAMVAIVGVGFFLSVMRPTLGTSRGPNYPRMGQYASMRWNGEPFAHNGIIDTAEVVKLSKYDAIIIDAARVGIRADIQRLVRAKSSAVILLAYLDAGQPFQCGPGWYGGPVPEGCDTTGTSFAWSRWVAIGRDSGIVYSRLTGKPFGPYGLLTNFARPGLADVLADTIAAWVGENGAFLDETCGTVLWEQNVHGDSIDFMRDGYTSLAEWDAAYQTGFARFMERVRLRLGSRLFVGNCGPSGPSVVNGWMLENYPNQRGSTVEDYLAADTSYTKPTLNWLSAWRSSEYQGDFNNRRSARYALADASLGGGVGALTGSQADGARGWLPWWWDEFAVNAQGIAVSDAASRGWLGRPRGPAYRAGVCWRRDFTHGCVLVNPTWATVTLSVGDGYRRILGSVSPDVNNGQPATSVALPPSDGLFLVHL